MSFVDTSEERSCRTLGIYTALPVYKYTGKATVKWFKTSHAHVFLQLSKSLDLNSIKKLWQDFKTHGHMLP